MGGPGAWLAWPPAPSSNQDPPMPQPEGAVTFQVPGAHSWKVGQGAAEVSITATLHGMYLGLWGRSSLLETAIIEGDKDLAVRVLQGPLTP